MKKLITLVAVLLLAAPGPATAYTDAQVDQEIDSLKQQVEKLTKDNTKLTKRIKSSRSPITISGDYQFRLDTLEGSVPDYHSFQGILGWMAGGMIGPPPVTPGFDAENSELWTNRFGLNIEARATKDINVKARLVMYKVWGHQSADPVLSGYFADRYSLFDGNASHVPSDSTLRVDQVYASWANAFGKGTWFSIGRRPSTGGVPTNIRHNTTKSGASGTPGILVDYAFDGLVLGYAPDIESLPGAYAKFCYGKGFDSGFQPDSSDLKDVAMAGLDVTAYDSEKLHVEVQFNRAFDIFAQPEMISGNVNLGDIDEFGAVVMGKAGSLNWFASAAMSKTHPNDNLFQIDSDGDGIPDMDAAGLLYDAPGFGGSKESKTGNAVYVGARYDVKGSGWKFGAEYNRGSEDWITFTPAADDMITGKLGVRGNVTEFYLIKELQQERVSRRARAFFKLGFQDYNFDYTGSNNWVGSPKDMDELTASPFNAQMMPPLEEASNMYFTYNVEF